MRVTLAPLLLMPIAAILIAACIPIPYKPSATVAPDAAIDVPSSFSVASDDDEVTQTLAKKIHSKDRKIAIAHVRGFEANSCPEGVVCQPATPTPVLTPAAEEAPIPEPPK
jgi:hypothetical protein